MTLSERKLWYRIRNKQLGCKFRRQYGIGPYIVDFYCPAHRLIIEIDGDSHFSDDAIEYDQVRTNFMQARGFKIIRFLNSHVSNDIDWVCEEIQKQFQITRHNPS
nr:endonuclease domain-containing protein [Vibrio maerlii]